MFKRLELTFQIENERESPLLTQFGAFGHGVGPWGRVFTFDVCHPGLDDSLVTDGEVCPRQPWNRFDYAHDSSQMANHRIQISMLFILSLMWESRQHQMGFSGVLCESTDRYGLVSKQFFDRFVDSYGTNPPKVWLWDHLLGGQRMSNPHMRRVYKQ